MNRYTTYLAVLVGLAIVCCGTTDTAAQQYDPALAEILQRLEATEQELADTQAQLNTLQARDAQRQQWENKFIRRLPKAESDDNFLSVSSSWNVHNSQPMPPSELETQIEQLGQSVEQLGAGMEQMGEGVEELGKALRITTVDENIKIGVFGWLRGEAVYTDQTTVLLAASFFATPDFAAVEQDNVRVHGRSTGIGAGIEGPCICGYDSGGLVLIYFFGNSVLSNSVGVFVAQAFGELKNDHSRIAFGIQSDIVGPRNPTVVNWGMYNGGGNTGFLRGQLRYERYFHPRCDKQWTVTLGISDPAPTNLAAALPEVAFTGSNGWPNVEGRIGLGLGCEYQDGLELRRPVEFGVSGMIGEVRTNLAAAPALPLPPVPGSIVTSVTDETWYAGVDVRVAMNDWLGFQGELFTGQGLGTYAGGILQTIDTVTFNTVRSEGGWGEVYVYWTPCLHSHFGYGVDDPRNSDLNGAGARYRNEVYFANIMWDVTDNFQVAFEYSHWDTNYRLLPDAKANVFHSRLQFSF